MPLVWPARALLGALVAEDDPAESARSLAAARSAVLAIAGDLPPGVRAEWLAAPTSRRCSRADAPRRRSASATRLTSSRTPADGPPGRCTGHREADGDDARRAAPTAEPTGLLTGVPAPRRPGPPATCWRWPTRLPRPSRTSCTTAPCRPWWSPATPPTPSCAAATPSFARDAVQEALVALRRAVWQFCVRAAPAGSPRALADLSARGDGRRLRRPCCSTCPMTPDLDLDPAAAAVAYRLVQRTGAGLDRALSVRLRAQPRARWRPGRLDAVPSDPDGEALRARAVGAQLRTSATATGPGPPASHPPDRRKRMTTVLICDDHRIVREGLRGRRRRPGRRQGGDRRQR